MSKPANGKVSLIVTVKNESSTISALLNSVALQTLLPDEVVVVDGGSTDGTVEALKRYSSSSPPFPLMIVSSPGANIPQGRNIAVRSASHGIIAVSDAGCRLDKGWLENITRPIREGRAEVVGGMTLGWHETEFEEVCSHILFMDIEWYRSRRAQPSARTLAFTRGAWEEVGGFDEITNLAEDTAFIMKLRKSSVPIDYAGDAIVYWRSRGGTAEVFRQFFGYSKGDGFRGLFILRYVLRWLAILALTAFVLAFWWNPLAWGIGMLIVLAELWFEWIRKVPRLNLRRLWMALKISLVIELGLTLGYPWGAISRLSG